MKFKKKMQNLSCLAFIMPKWQCWYYNQLEIDDVCYITNKECQLTTFFVTFTLDIMERITGHLLVTTLTLYVDKMATP